MKRPACAIIFRCHHHAQRSYPDRVNEVSLLRSHSHLQLGDLRDRRSAQSKHASSPNLMAFNDEVERRGAAPATNEADLS
jgi:hypothetical protein